MRLLLHGPCCAVAYAAMAAVKLPAMSAQVLHAPGRAPTATPSTMWTRYAAHACCYINSTADARQRGQVIDPPTELTARPQPLYTHTRVLTSRSPTPDSAVMSTPVESPFCGRCEKNQMIVNRALAEWLPDEDDPEYANQEKALPQYQAQLEEQFPQVCESCIDRVKGRIRQAGYAAKAEAVGRKLEQSKKYQDKKRTTRQLWTLIIISLAKCVYIATLIATLGWHLLAAISHFGAGHHHFDPKTCVVEALTTMGVDKSCVVSTPAREWVSYALLGDVLTIWWNPKLAYKTTHANQRMSGMVSQWMIRGCVALLNAGVWFLLREPWVQADGAIVADQVHFFQLAHTILFILQSCATWLSWRMVTVHYVTTKELLRPLDAHLPQALPSNESTPHATPRKLLPNHTSFDSMAAAFSSSFHSEAASYEPPSPTLTAVSTATTETSDFTPWKRRQSSTIGEEMDWTPTKPRFNARPPDLLPSRVSLTSPSKPPHGLGRPDPPNPPVSIFRTGPDANPFRRRVPAAPKAPAAQFVDPWKRPAWQPDPLVREKNLFDEDKERNKVFGAGLHGKGVPRTVERQAQLFEPPKFKFEAEAYGGGEKTTGLEDTFNNLFSK